MGARDRELVFQDLAATLPFEAESPSLDGLDDQIIHADDDAATELSMPSNRAPQSLPDAPFWTSPTARVPGDGVAAPDAARCVEGP